MHVLKRFVGVVPLLGLVAIVLGLPTTALGRDDSREFRARLIGINEVPSINTGGSATLRLKVRGDEIDFDLRYQNLSAPPGAAHIHFGQQHTNGGVMVFFCGGGGKPSCPATTSGSVTGTITPANVLGIPAQGLTAGDMAAVLRAIRSGASYANMHTVNFTSGEIRGQIHAADD